MRFSRLFILAFLFFSWTANATDLVLEVMRLRQYDKLGQLEDLNRWIGVPESCHSHTRTLMTLLKSYHLDAIRSQNPKSKWATSAESTYKKITAQLADLERNQQDCFEPVARAYAVAAVGMLESSYDQALLKLASYFALHLPQWNRDTETPRLRLLTPERRAQASSCGWATSGKIYSYQYYGGYFCKTSSIAIDPYLPPLNLGASFVHEIDHFLRDRFGRTATSWDETRELTVYDEVLSSALGAFFQLRLTQDPRKHVANRSWLWSFEMGRDFLKSIPEKNGFKLSFDNNLFLEKGPLWSILKDLKNPVLTNAKDFMIASGLLPCGLDTLTGAANTYVTIDPKAIAGFSREKNRAKVNEIFSRIYQAYFKDPRPLPFSSPAMPLFPSKQYRQACFAMSPLLALYGDQNFTSLVLEPSQNVFPLIELFHQKLSTPTRSCNLFYRGMSDGPGVIEDGMLIDLAGLGSNYRAPLSDYVGVCNSHPGNEGGKTGNEGGKTGNEGGKTGNEGGKTTFESARPCLEVTP